MAAIERYKQQHNAIIINNNNKEQISDMLRKKIAIDFWTNEEFSLLDAHKITQRILYITGFVKISMKQNFKLLKEEICKLQLAQLQTLPPIPNDIPEEIRTSLPFSLPIANRRNIRAVAAALRCTYTFERLPDAYISDTRIQLPAYPHLLNTETRDMFPITSRAKL